MLHKAAASAVNGASLNTFNAFPSWLPVCFEPNARMVCSNDGVDLI